MGFISSHLLHIIDLPDCSALSTAVCTGWATKLAPKVQSVAAYKCYLCWIWNWIYKLWLSGKTFFIYIHNNLHISYIPKIQWNLGLSSLLSDAKRDAAVQYAICIVWLVSLPAVQGHLIPVNLPCWPAISRHCHLLPRELAVSHAKKMWDAYGCVFSVSKLTYNSNVRGGSLVIAASFAFTIATQESSLMWIQPIKPIKSHSIGKYSVRSLEALPVTETSRVVCSLGKQKERAQLQRPQQLWAQLKRSQQNSCL